MTTITWHPASGSSLAFTRPNYYVTSFRGFGGSPVDIRTMRAPYQHGGTLVDTRQAPRDLGMDIWATSASIDGMWDRRRELMQAFNPRIGVGRLHVLRPDGGEYEIQAFPEEPGIFAPPDNPHAWRVRVELMAPYPNWRDPTETVTSPLQPPTTVGIQNDGDIPAHMEITFDGPVENPRLAINTSPQLIIFVEKTLASGESIKVITGPGSPRVNFSDANGTVDGMRFIAAISDIAGFAFPVGSSDITYSSDDQATAGRGTPSIHWRQWYVGI